MGRQVKELTSTQRTINIIIVAALLIYSAVNLYLVVTAYSKLDKQVDLLGDIVTNWKTKSISDVVIANSCPSGYEQAFGDRYWPGTNDGCWCGSVSDSVKQAKNITCGPFCTGQCSSVQSTAGCSNVPGKGRQLLNYVGTKSGTPVQICLKRSSESWDEVAPISSGNCPLGYTKCGTSADKVFCTKEALCPITSITLEGVNAAACASNTDCRTFSDTEQLILKRGNTEDELPLSQFRLNEFNMCALKSQDNITPRRTVFDLISKSINTCYSEGSSRWNTEGQITEANLFQYNNLATYISSLTAFPNPARGMSGYYPTGQDGSKYTWGMFSRNYVPWKVSCRDRMQPFIDKKSFVDNAKKAQLALLIIGIISTIFLGFVLSFMEIQNLRGVDLSCIDGKGEEERTKLKRFKKFVNYGFKGIQLPFQIWAIVIATGSKNLFADVAASDCSSGEIDANIDFLANNLALTHRSNLTALAMLIATLVLDLILAAWDKRSRKGDTTAVSPQPHQEMNQSSARPLAFNNSTPGSPNTPQQPQYPQQQNPGQPNLVIEVLTGNNQPAPAPYNPQQQQYPQQQPGPMQFAPQPQQYPQQQQQQYPQQQPGPMQFAPQPQQYPQQYPQQQPGPMQFAPQQYPQQQTAPMQFAPQPQQYPPQQQQYQQF